MGRPSGTVTFLFSDIEGSTRLWETAPAALNGRWPEDWMTTGHYAFADLPGGPLAQALDALAPAEREALAREAGTMSDEDVLGLAVACVDRLAP